MDKDLNEYDGYVKMPYIDNFRGRKSCTIRKDVKSVVTVFLECHVVDLDLEASKKEMLALRSREKTPILKECASCFTCNIVCPKEANPMDPISFFRKERYDEDAPPGIAKLTIPKYPSNMYGLASKLCSEDEKEVLHECENPEPNSELALPDCAVSYMTQYHSKTSLFKGYLFAGGMEFCCGMGADAGSFNM